MAGATANTTSNTVQENGDFFSHLCLLKQAQIIRSLTMVIEPKQVGAVLMQILIFF